MPRPTFFCAHDTRDACDVVDTITALTSAFGSDEYVALWSIYREMYRVYANEVSDRDIHRRIAALLGVSDNALRKRLKRFKSWLISSINVSDNL